MLEDGLLLQRIQAKILNNQSKADTIRTAKNYYNNKNDILLKGIIPKGEGKDPLRNADNRIPHNIHQILVDEKISYLFTYPPIIDIEDNEEINEKVNQSLGDGFERKLKNIGIEASNCGTAWMHYWIEIDEDTGESKFKYEVVNTEEIIPVYDNGLERKLKNIIRYYKVKEEVLNQLDEITYAYIEYWTDNKMIRWKMKDSFTNTPIEESEDITHTLGDVPFIEFSNNKEKNII